MFLFLKKSSNRPPPPPPHPAPHQRIMLPCQVETQITYICLINKGFKIMSRCYPPPLPVAILGRRGYRCDVLLVLLPALRFRLLQSKEQPTSFELRWVPRSCDPAYQELHAIYTNYWLNCQSTTQVHCINTVNYPTCNWLTVCEEIFFCGPTQDLPKPRLGDRQCSGLLWNVACRVSYSSSRIIRNALRSSAPAVNREDAKVIVTILCPSAAHSMITHNLSTCTDAWAHARPHAHTDTFTCVHFTHINSHGNLPTSVTHSNKQWSWFNFGERGTVMRLGKIFICNL